MSSFTNSRVEYGTINNQVKEASYAVRGVVVVVIIVVIIIVVIIVVIITMIVHDIYGDIIAW